jgi:phosphoribosyl isomerase A
VSLTLLPALDVRRGLVAQADQQVADGMPKLSDPIVAAAHWQQQGAAWLHLVDLDTAFGHRQPRETAAALAQIVSTLSIPVQLSGGVADEAALARAQALRPARIVVSTAALRDLAWCREAIERFGVQLVFALDVSILRVAGRTQHRLTPRGTDLDVGDLWSTVEYLATHNCARYLVTDVSRDGQLNGPNTELLRSFCSRVDLPVVASGGVSSLEDVSVLVDLHAEGVEGVVVGTALYQGLISLPSALQIAQQ